MLHKVEPQVTRGYPNLKCQGIDLQDGVPSRYSETLGLRHRHHDTIIRHKYCLHWSEYTLHNWYSWKYVDRMKLIYYLFYLIMDEIMVTLWSTSSRSSLKRYSRHETVYQI